MAQHTMDELPPTLVCFLLADPGKGQQSLSHGQAETRHKMFPSLPIELLPYPEEAEALQVCRGLWKPSSVFGWERLCNKRREISPAEKYSAITTLANKILIQFPSFLLSVRTSIMVFLWFLSSSHPPTPPKNKIIILV